MANTPNKVLLLINLLLCILNSLWGTYLFQQHFLDNGADVFGNRLLLPHSRRDGGGRSDGVYAHDNRNLESVAECTKEQFDNITYQLNLKDGGRWIGKLTRCPDNTWIESFFEEEDDIGSEMFLGISVGCNKGHDGEAFHNFFQHSCDCKTGAWKLNDNDSSSR